MRRKTAQHIRQDLESRGVAPEFSRSISRRLARFSHELSVDTYEAVLSGVAMAYGVHREERPATPAPDPARAERPADLDEVERLMSSFSSELLKLDEALETLAAYVTRLRTRTLPANRTLH